MLLDVLDPKPIACSTRLMRNGNTAIIPRNSAPGRVTLALDLGQILLGWGPTIDTRDLRTDLLKVLTVVLLGEEYVRIEESKTDYHQEVQ